MKFANLYWQSSEIVGSDVCSVNIGDNLQFLAIEYLYQQMGIQSKDIVRLKMDELSGYQGEELILPLNWALFDSSYMKKEKISISANISPVFLSVTICSQAHKDEYFNEYNIDYLKKHEPIGCRDVYTMKVLQRYGIRAYTNGCMTATLPRRTKTNKTKRIFVVDAPAGLINSMPKEIYQKCEVMTQQYYYSKNVEISKIVEDVIAQYKKYEEEAALVITSRLHVAVPCMAMGIPVIVTKNKIDQRFGWLDTLIPLYGKEEFDIINWNPASIEYEELKKKILDNAARRVMSTYEDFSTFSEVSTFYENNKERDYIGFQQTIQNNFEGAYDFLAERYEKDDCFIYSIWGANDAAENFYKEMSKRYPNARLRNVIDSYKKMNFHGITTIKPEEFIQNEKEVIIVLPVKASNVAKKILTEKGINGKDFICAGDIFFQKEKY